MAGWWTKHTNAKPEAGSIATFRFTPDYEKHMRIDKLVPNKQVDWTCIKGDEEWLNTQLSFDLKQEGEFVIVDFRHSGWAAQTQMFGLCSYHWALYMKSLKDLVETGQGQPHKMNRFVHQKPIAMNKYMYLFRGGDARMAELSNEEQQSHMERWGAWMKKLGEAGNFVDGLPLGPEGKQVKQNGDVVTDGPYVEGKEVVGGYLIVNAKDLNHATELAKDCPIFENDGEVEVRPILSMDY